MRSGNILHVDMDAFYAAIELLDRPDLKGKPVVIGAPPGRRGVVSTASYEARAYGIRSAMPSRTAARLCPEAVFLPVRMRRYAEVSEQLMLVLGSFTPLVEQVSVDEAFLDVSGARREWGDSVAIARALKQRVRADLGLTASVGVAPNKFLAKLASDLEKPDGLTVTPVDDEEIRAFLAPLPVGKLWGVGEKAEARLHRAGLRTIGDIQGCPLKALRDLVGEAMSGHIHALAHGEDDRHVVTEREARSISSEHTFDEDCRDPEVQREVMVQMTECVGRRLRKAGLKASVGGIKYRLEDFSTFTRQRTFPAPTATDRDLIRCALMLLEQQGIRRPVRLLGFGVSKFVEDGQVPDQGEFDLGDDRGRDRDERLDEAVDKVRTRFGRTALRRGVRRLPSDQEE